MKRFHIISFLIAFYTATASGGVSAGGTGGGSGSPALVDELSNTASEYAKLYLNSRALLTGEELPQELQPSHVDARVNFLRSTSLKRLSTEYGNAFVATHQMLNADSEKVFSSAESEKAAAEKNIESILSEEE